MYSCIRDFLFGFGSPIDAVSCSSGRRTTRNAWPQIRKSLAVSQLRRGVRRRIAAACVRVVVSAPPLSNKDVLPTFGVRGSIERLENASVPPAVNGGAPAPAASAAADIFGFTFASIFEDAHGTGAATPGSFLRKDSAAARRDPGVTGRISGPSPAAPAFMSQPPRALPAREPFESPPAAPPAVDGREKLAEQKTLAEQNTLTGALASLSAHHFVKVEVRLHAVLLLVVELVVRLLDVRVRAIARSYLARTVLSRTL